MKIRAFITHKLAEKYEDCQDSYSISNNAIAVSDGMSQSIFPNWWAESLTKAFVKDNWIPDTNNLEDIRLEWINKVNHFIDTETSKGKNLWRLKNSIAEKKGAGATICGIRFNNETDWAGYVLGDTCVIEINVDNQVERIYTSQEGSFDNHPDYFDSFSEGKGEPKVICGKLTVNNKLIIASDPFVDFLYEKRGELGEANYIKQLFELENNHDFCELVDNWRKNEGLHNDDSTLILIEYDDKISLDIVYDKGLHSLIEEERNNLETENLNGDISVNKQEEDSNNTPTVAFDEVTKAANSLKRTIDNYLKNPPQKGSKNINRINVIKGLIRTIINFLDKNEKNT